MVVVVVVVVTLCILLRCFNAVLCRCVGFRVYGAGGGRASAQTGADEGRKTRS